MRFVLLIIIALFTLHQFPKSQERSIQPFKKPFIKEKPTEVIIQPDVEKNFSFPTSGTTELTEEIIEYLELIANYLKENPCTIVRLTGHSDDQGTFSQNQKRSEDRAKQVVQYLVSKGIASGRLFPRGDGARVPVGDNRSEDGRKRNRRVEILIVQ